VVLSTARGEAVSTVKNVIRQCSRTGCADRATATFSYQYVRSLVWLDHLHAERDPHTYDLCERHANRLAVPSGWQLDDLRVTPAVRLAS